MASYIHGNLAVEERKEQKAGVREKRKVVYRKKSIPTQEKLLYLFTVIVCCIVAGVIIWRYAQIYEINTTLQQIERDIKQLETENNELKLEISKLQSPERIIDAARRLGLDLPGETEVTQVEVKNRKNPVNPPGRNSHKEEG